MKMTELLGIGMPVMALGVFALLNPHLRLRAGLLLFVLLSGVSSAIGVSGGFGVLVIVLVLRDLDVVLRLTRARDLVWTILTFALLILLESGDFAVGVILGIVIALYLSAAIRAGGLRTIAWGGLLGGCVFAVRNLSAPVITVADRVNGDVTMVGRRMLPNLDPNATAAILLVGITCGVLLAVHLKGLAALGVFGGMVLMTVSIVLLAARYAMVAAVLSIVFLWLTRGNLRRKLVMGALAAVAMVVVVPVVGDLDALARFGKLESDAGGRASIYSAWGKLILEEGFLFGLPPGVIASQPVAPHNAVLELGAHFGVAGLLAVSVAARMVVLPFRREGWQVRVASLSILGFAMIVGIVAQYTPWVALVLLNAQSWDGDKPRVSANRAATFRRTFGPSRRLPIEPASSLDPKGGM